MTTRRGISNQAGRDADVDFRQLAREMGLPCAWRRWTVEDFIAACSDLCGLEGRQRVKLRQTDLFHEAHVETWDLVSPGRGRPRRDTVLGSYRVKGTPRVRGQYAALAVVLCHAAVEALAPDEVHPCLAAEASRLLLAGRALVEHR